ncbi:hypothetical protein DFJ58DRAFT_719381 [Suillus subalutaceus]|uniref:uncharacterized protein n=1 Tax=Suillus subalutaceus TaxID=48586 RepID=UPI001B86C704|nr:uncharacterized protein DFJ58DRAFT_719381 [Suillus subalutaceus]KAG1834042.1 hypothetical protein DFJ58DRAFT_719381 [Suillus subalutaceus]
MDSAVGTCTHSAGKIYHHNIARFNFTTYNIRRAQDIINPRTPHCNIMILKCHDDHNDGLCNNYCYSKVLGIHHVNTRTLGRVCLMPLSNHNELGFVNPAVVLRACHIIPAFSRGQHNPNECGISPLAGDKNDWYEYYVNR